MTNSEILSTVIENGRVSGDENGLFNVEELKVEIEFEATEQGLSDDEVAEAVEFALSHTQHN